MKIKHIELKGFKSFKNRTLIQFREGICGIVGPNGCGKSNIVDAVLWVIGETRPAIIRGSCMEDVIFVGSEGMQAAGVVEVSMVLESSDRNPFPEEYKNLNEIMVTRRLDRDGKSEYLINSQLCRLQDVQEIFMDTNAGRHGVGFMEQGAVEHFISSRPEQKRLLIESTAGISKFRMRKKSAQRKLELTEGHLNRLKDVLNEKENQLKKLKKQSEKAKDFRSLKKEIQQKDLQISWWKLKDFQKEINLLDNQLEKENIEQNKQQKQIDDMSEYIKQLTEGNQLSDQKNLVQKIQKEEQDLLRELSLVEKTYASLQAVLKVNKDSGGEWQEAGRLSQHNRMELLKSIQENKNKITTIEKQLNEVLEQQKQIAEECKTLEKLFLSIQLKTKENNTTGETEKKVSAITDDEWKKGVRFLLKRGNHTLADEMLFSQTVVTDSYQELLRLQKIHPAWSFLTLDGKLSKGNFAKKSITKPGSLDSSISYAQKQQLQNALTWRSELSQKRISLEKDLSTLKEKGKLLNQSLEREQQIELSFSSRSQQKQQTIEQCQLQIKEKEKTRVQLLEQLSEKKIDLDKCLKAYEQLRQNLDQKRLDIIEQHKSISNRESVINEINIKKTGLVERKSALCMRIKECYQLDLIELKEDHLTDENALDKNQLEKDQWEEELNTLNQKLARFGEVNLLALKEYEELSKSKDFYQQQYEDLCSAKEQLVQVIKRVDRFCSNKFQEVFDQVNGYFSKVFPALFDGGCAKLILTDDGGVDVFVQPAGKKIQNMNLLSGGEKSMVAVAVIFSLFLVKPSPFCILDEIDAPLDDINIARFGSLLKEMSQISQVIIITHNRYTMQMCDSLYGVTMEEKGISKIVSLENSSQQLYRE